MSNQNPLPHLICDEMRLDSAVFPHGRGGKWQWTTKNGKLGLVERDDFSRSVAFSLDTTDPTNIHARFPFLRKSEDRVQKISRICDIIVLMRKNDSLRAFVIEVKDSNSNNAQANIQIKNGIFFCEWLHRLLNEHCGIPARLEIVRIISLAKRKHKRSKSQPINANPEPLRDIQTLQYNSNVKTIELQHAYARCKEENFLNVKTIAAKQ